jgi:hypothetical protein
MRRILFLALFLIVLGTQAIANEAARAHDGGRAIASQSR